MLSGVCSGEVALPCHCTRLLLRPSSRVFVQDILQIISIYWPLGDVYVVATLTAFDTWCLRLGPVTDLIQCLTYALRRKASLPPPVQWSIEMVL